MRGLMSNPSTNITGIPDAVLSNSLLVTLASFVQATVSDLTLNSHYSQCSYRWELTHSCQYVIFCLSLWAVVLISHSLLWTFRTFLELPLLMQLPVTVQVAPTVVLRCQFFNNPGGQCVVVCLALLPDCKPEWILSPHYNVGELHWWFNQMMS